jgi:hypothetical protein
MFTIFAENKVDVFGVETELFLVSYRTSWGILPQTPVFLASLGVRSVETTLFISKSSYFLGDPPPDPRFFASLGVLSR